MQSLSFCSHICEAKTSKAVNYKNETNSQINYNYITSKAETSKAVICKREAKTFKAIINYKSKAKASNYKPEAKAFTEPLIPMSNLKGQK